MRMDGPKTATSAGMFMRSLFETPAISVGELCRRIKNALEIAFINRVRVTGEVAQCSVATSGHVYFDLKDADGLIKCVCFKSTAVTLSTRFPLDDGAAVEVTGRVTAYKERSQYQIIVDDVVPAGRGELYRKFELLKEKLQREGLFDESRKRPIPDFVKNVAIVTSRGSAALQDFLATCRRRGAHVTVMLVHAPVQGGASVNPLAKAILYAGTLPVQAVVVARGGGSIEDLWSFNTEIVARAIVRCARPVISAIGHETDYTIADFVADRRAATPTAAAEMVSPDRRKLLASLAEWTRRLTRCLLRAVRDAHVALGRAVASLETAPQSIIEFRTQRLDDLESALRSFDPRRRAVELRGRVTAADRLLHVAAARAFINALERIRASEERQRLAFAKTMVGRRSQLDVAAARLAVLGPSKTLERGYAIVFDRRGKILTESSQTAAGDAIDITLRRGRVAARVTATEDRHGENGVEEED